MHPPQRDFKFILAFSLCAALALGGCGGGGGASADGTAAPSAVTPPADIAQAPTTASAVVADLTGPPAVDTPPPVKELSVNTPTVAESIATALATAAAVPPASQATALQAPGSPDGNSTAGATPATSVDIFVTLDGNDSWSGNLSVPNALRTDGPLRTLKAAQMVVRQRLAAMVAGSPRLPINVRIGAGEYRLTEQLALGPLDSGAPGAPVVYRAENYGTVTLSGAVRVASATGSTANTVMALPVPPLDPATIRGGTQLFVNGQRATLARSPNAGSFWFVNKALPLAEEPADAKGQEAFVPPAAALTFINGLSGTERNQAIVQVMQEWTSGWHRLSALAAPAGSVRVSPRTYWPFLWRGFNQRFFVENVASALDAPGEWIWDTSGLRYIATATDAGQALAFDMPLLDRLILVAGNAATDVLAHDIEFRGLNFAYTRQITPDAGYRDNQAGVAVGAAIEVDAARRIVIDSCAISRTGGYAVWLRTAVRESQVTNCRMTDIGAGGVKVGSTVVWPTGANNTGLNTISSNSIVGTGKVVPGAVGIWVGRSSDNLITNNLIANTTYSAISVGWTWGYGETTASGNKITNNLLLNIGQGQLSDLAAIYTLGESPGTVISGNVIHEVRSYPGYGVGSWGLYNDEGSAGILMERNIVIGTDDGGYLLHYGRNNTVRNNLMAYGDRGEVRVTRSEPLLTKLDFNNNLLIPKTATPLLSFATAPDVLYSANKVSNRVLPLATPADLSKCGSGCTVANVTMSVGADPRIVTLAGADGATSSWVSSVGATVGPPGLPLIAIPAVSATPPPVVAAPPVIYSAELGETAVGGRPFNLKYVLGGNDSSINVQADSGTPSGKSLRFVDAPAIVNRWEPYAWAILNHTKVSTTVEFTIRIDAASNFLHEWRDDATAFLAGPSLRVKSAGIEVAGKIVARAPVGEWIKLKITAPLDAAAGTWIMQANYADGSVVTVPNLAIKNAGWKRLNWLGFVSDAAVSSTASIGLITARNDAPVL